MGEVWLARDSQEGSEVALKVLHLKGAGDTHPKEILQREYHQTRGLVHPGIVRVFGIYHSEDLSYLAMEYLPGGDLSPLLGRPWHRIVDLLLPVTEALRYAHAQGVIHRDIKLANVLLDARGHPVITDFGVAATSGQPLGPARFPGGSLPCMSPQQLRGEPPHPTDDVYGLGVLCHQLLSGSLPFPPQAGDRGMGCREPPPLITPYTLPIRLSDLVRRMLAPERSDRPQDMADVARALRALPHPARRTAAMPAAPDTVPAAYTPTLPAEALPDTRPPPEHPVASRPPPTRSTPPPPPQGDPAVPAAGPGPQHRGPRRPWLRSAIGAILVILVAMAAGVIFLLPALVERDPVERVDADLEPAAPVKPAPAPQPGATRAAVSEAGRTAAEQALGRFLARSETLQKQAVTNWGGADYTQAQALGSRGDAALGRREFSVARQAYDEAAQLLDRLAARRIQWLNAALEQGTQALDDGDPAAAGVQFRRALSLSSGEPRATRGLARAERLAQALDRVRTARQAAQADRLETARQDFKAALELEPELEGVRKELEAVEARLQAQRFEAHMSGGLSALLAGELDRAARELEQAREIQPQAPELRDALEQLVHAREQARLTALHAQARRLEQAEQWSQAAKRYQEILAVDPNLASALAAHSRAVERARIDSRLEDYLKDPLRLASLPVYRGAQDLLEEAQGIPDPGPRLSRQRESLERLLVAVNTPIPLPLKSDNLTEVTIYRVGRLGHFLNRTVKLRPGRYTLVGSRPGYRDVRLSVIVTADKTPPPVEVRCEEPV